MSPKSAPIPKPDGRCKINLQAYQGITFMEMFGTVSSNQVVEHADETGKELVGTYISLGVFVERVLENLKTRDIDEAEDRSVCDSIIEILKKLRKHLEKLGGAVRLKTWRVRALCEHNFREIFPPVAASRSATPQQKKRARSGDVVGELYQFFDDLEEAGLMLPWSVITHEKKYDAFRSLVYGTRFLQRTGRMTFSDFATIVMDHPLVDDELIDVTQYAIQVGLFGARRTCACASDPKAKVSSGEPAARATRGYINSCCNWTTRKCQYINNPTYNCGPTGSSCPLGAVRCPGT